jgi:hypothetical protein
MIWDSYPNTYRAIEVARLLDAVRAGDCAWVVGVSGSGKSNLAGFFVHRVTDGPQKIWVDLNRLTDLSSNGLFGLLARLLGGEGGGYAALETALSKRLESAPNGLCLVFDRFEILPEELLRLVGANLRALRDAYKYQLTYIVTSRLAPDPLSELAELFAGHLLWLGALAEDDALWSARQYAQRHHLEWNEVQCRTLLAASGCFASLLRAACEAAASGCPFEVSALQTHPAMQRRVEEFLLARPGAETLKAAKLLDNSLLNPPSEMPAPDLTAAEARLLVYLQAHPGQVCEKDDLVKAVWPEDRVYSSGIRDDSLTQLVRRLRCKIETDPGQPEHIQTVPGRGYRYLAGPSLEKK